ncbi:MAG TPA: hypothetical protein VN457_01005, partial [Chlamydiales bacterium]|nr:hypothetical protein [Chlamydiales bacterium]
MLKTSHDLQSSSDNPPTAQALLITGIAIIIVLAGFNAGLIFQISPIWLSFFLVGLGAPFFSLLYLKYVSLKAPSNLAMLLRIVTSISFFGAIGFLLVSSVDAPQPKSFLLVPCLLGIAVLCTLAFSGQMPVSLTGGKRSLFYSLVLVTFSLACWVSFLDLPNWHQFNKSLADRPLATSIFFVFFAGVVHRYLFKTPDPPLTPALSVLNAKLNRTVTFILAASALVVFFIMSFRYDTLFLGTSEGHWEYYIGPIRTLKNGSWLLWDTPSQYGFLNILAASFMPFKSAWESFYVLQGALLFVASVMMFKICIGDRSFSGSIFFCFAITLSSIFFADPDLIGPYLYPSSSVMRFFWCYVLLYFLVHSKLYSNSSLKKMILMGTLLWLSGFLWSSESAIYSSVIFFPAIFVAIWQDYHRTLNPGEKGHLIRHLFLHM